MFICPNCNKKYTLPRCTCGYVAQNKDGIWQLSDDLDIIINGDKDKYIGYEYIGENYSGNRRYLIEEKDYEVAKEISFLTGNGIFLDLACGDGCFTVPVASFGTRIIAGDISNLMLRILYQKARYNEINLRNVTICRINVLNIPIADNTIDCVIANSVLHLVSNAKKVLKEIYRVLKPDGVLIRLNDAPGKQVNSVYDNSSYYEIVNSIYSRYWEILMRKGVLPQKYNWDVDTEEICSNLFTNRTTKIIKFNRKLSILLKEGFMPRFMGRGFSEQVNVPKDLHDKVISRVINECVTKYGKDFDNVSFRGVESDIKLTVYKK